MEQSRARAASWPAARRSAPPARGRRPRFGFDRAQAGDHDDAPRLRDHARGARDVVRMRRNRRELRQQLARRRRQGSRPRPGPVLQIERNADHHRPALAPRLQEGIADRDRHALGQVQAVIGGACRRDERRLVDGLVVPAALQRRLAGKHHQRDACARTAAGSAVISCVTPGPQVTVATPTSPVLRA